MPWISLPLFGYAIPVHLVDGLADQGGAEGSWSPERRRIYLDAGLEPERRIEVLVHECLHAVADLAGIELDELHVRVLALGLHQMLGRAVDLPKLGG